MCIRDRYYENFTWYCLWRKKRASGKNHFVPIDYEQSSAISYTENYNFVEVKWCSFRFAQSILQKLKELGLYTEYLHDESFKIQIQCLQALDFLPIPFIGVALEEIEQGVSEEVEDFLSTLIEHLD